MKCEGDACSRVEISWDPLVGAYRVKNHGERSVVVTLTGYSGETRIAIEPRQDAVVYIEEFELPYRAFFL